MADPCGSQPIVTKEALARWASNQATLIERFVKDEERQALCAEVVLECGGDIGNLKFVKWGSDWLGENEFIKRIERSTEIAISFNGEFDYDEDLDVVHPKDFRESFSGSEDIVVVLKHNGTILNAGTISWPYVVTGQTKSGDSNVAEFIRNIIKETWGDDFEEEEDERIIGAVDSSNISRRITIFRPSET